jgi:hypothetical protein
MTQLTEMVQPPDCPVDDREGHLPFDPFTPLEWLLTALLVVVCFGLPIGMIVHYQREMARLNAPIVEASHE